MGKVKNFPPYEEARKRMIEEGINSPREYRTRHKEVGLPSAPDEYYKGKGWIDWTDYCGRETVVFPSHEDAKSIVKKNGIKTQSEYYSRFKELGLPSHPDMTYNGKGWIDWTDFLGKEAIVFPSYEGAKRIVREKGIKSKEDYCDRNKELGLPSNPNRFYKEEWIDWPSFLGKEGEKSCEEAHRIVVEAGIKSMRDYKTKYKKLGLQSHPNRYYKGKGWIDWPTFLGKLHKTSHKERREKVLSKLALNPILFGDKAPLQIIYMMATNMDKELASEIEILLNMTSCEDRLNWVKEQLKTLMVDTPTSDTSSETMEDEIPAMESMLEIFEDSMDDLLDEDSISIKTILENYYHNLINKELIGKYDG